MGGVGMNTSKVLRLKTVAAAHIVIRNRAGKKLFEMDVPGVCITITVPLTAAIEVEPEREGTR